MIHVSARGMRSLTPCSQRRRKTGSASAAARADPWKLWTIPTANGVRSIPTCSTTPARDRHLCSVPFTLHGVRFSPDLRDGVAGGDITVSIRLWQRPKVRVGGRYESDGFQIEIDSIEVLPFSAVTADDISRSGESDRKSLRQRAAHAGPVHDDTLVYRIEFHVV
jgi:hypothetical protein